MIAKYTVTEDLKSYIKALRKNLLGYTNEEFGTIIDNRAASWVYAIEKTNKKEKGTTITPETLRTIFLAEYNYNLFKMKLKKMEELLDKAIADGIIKEGTTLETIYGEKTRVEDGKNVSFIVPPMEIFNGNPQRCSIPEQYFVSKSKFRDDIFDESLFRIVERYVPMQYNAQLTFWQEINVSQYISFRAKTLLERFGGVDDNYWLLAMYLMNAYVRLTDTCLSYLKKIFDIDKNSDVKWENLFDILNLNEKFKLKSRYDDENLIYFLNEQDKPVASNNVPVFDIKYNIQYTPDKDDAYFKEMSDKYNKLMKKIQTFEKPYAAKKETPVLPEEYYVELSEMYNEWGCDDAKIILAYSDYFKLTDIFMLIYRDFLKQDVSESEAFNSTCLELYNNGIITLLNDKEIGLGIKPDIDYETASPESTELSFALIDFFKNKNLSKTDIPLIKFRDNYLRNQHRFLSVIAMDFSDIENLSNAKCAMLNKKLEKTLKDFLDENLPK